MMEKWKELRPDKPLSRSALPTQGKRVHDRATKNLHGKNWLSADELGAVTAQVEKEFVGEPSVYLPEPNDEQGTGESETIDNPLTDKGEENICQRPSTERPNNEEYKALLSRAIETYKSISGDKIQEQCRRKPKRDHTPKSNVIG